MALLEARHATQLRKYDIAARWYLTLFAQLSLEEGKKYVGEFIDVLEEMASNADDYSEQLMLLLQSRIMFPNEPVVLNACVRFFFCIGRHLEAFDCAHEAVKQGEGITHVTALANLENIRTSIMDPWHWTMLNDAHRNATYAKAIQVVANARPKSCVLEIGAGTGILTAIASRYFKRNVYCCEMNQNMCDIAEKVLNQKVIRKCSMEVTIEDVGFENVDVLITETMDCGLLGEGIACFLYDAYTRILSPSSVIIPNCATVYAYVVESPTLMDEHLTVFCGRYFVSESVTASYHPCGVVENNEPYCCTSATEIRGGYIILSQTVEIFSINFHSCEELNAVVENGITELRFAPIIQDGTAHCIMAWFSCELFPGLPCIDTGPGKGSCWQQIIYPLPKPIALRKDSICTLKVRAFKDQLLCALEKIVLPDDAVIDNERSLDDIVILPKNDFLLTNDSYLLHFLENSLIEVFTDQELVINDSNKIYVVDITDLSILSMTLARKFTEDNDYADILMFWPISSHGFMMETTLDHVISFRLSNSRARVIPSKVTVVGQVISCPGVVQQCKPCPSAYQGVDLSVIYDLALSFHYDIEQMPTNESNLPDFMCLLGVASEAVITADGIADGLLYWFDIESGNQLYSTKSRQSLSRCAMYLFDESRKVTKDERLSVKSSHLRGFDMRLHLFNARRATDRKQYNVAADCYIELFSELSWEESKQYVHEFVRVLDEMKPNETGFGDHVLLLFRSLLPLPEEPVILKSLSKYLAFFGQVLTSLEFSIEAVEKSEGVTHIDCMVNLEIIRSNIVKSYDWVVFNSSRRVSSYEAALENIARWRPDSKLLIAGCGLGIIPSIASRYFHQRKFSYDFYQWIGLTERIENQPAFSSFTWLAMALDIVQPLLDVVIIDVMAYGTLGEKVAVLMNPIEKRLLMPYRISVPKTMTAYACFIECPAIMQEHNATFDGHNFASECSLVCYGKCKLGPLKSTYHRAIASEIRGGYRVLSRSVEIFSINLCSLVEMTKIMLDGILEHRQALIFRNGTAHGIMAWISCDMFPGIPCISSSPRSNISQHQAIFPLPIPQRLFRGNRCTLEVKVHEEFVFCRYKDEVLPYSESESEMSPKRYSTMTNGDSDSRNSSSGSALSFNLDNDDYINQVPEQSDSECYSGMDVEENFKYDDLDVACLPTVDNIILSYEDTAKLSDIICLTTNDFLLMNDESLVHFFRSNLNELQKQEEFTTKQICALDITNICKLSLTLIQSFPEIAFLCYNHEAGKLATILTPNRFVKFPVPPDHKASLENIPAVCFLRAPRKPFFTLFENSESMDVLLFWPISSHGSLIEAALHRLYSFRLSNSQARIIPSKISVVGQVIECPDILSRSRADPKIYEAMYSTIISNLVVSSHYDIELSRLNYTALSDPSELLCLEFDKEMPKNELDLPEFICLIEMVSEMVITRSGYVDGLLYWFNVGDGNRFYSTKFRDNLCRCAIYIFHEKVNTRKNRTVVDVGDSTLWTTDLDLFEFKLHPNVYSQ
ncbi:unnamed protein product [Thelazia callipaeda]|uniref:TPR_REGION domain-containing protein n=1 Tax=Thelazia callipaeda TaxID=103827 RepID=A0A158RB02_THECL|nr:unnamed protein product [Thelazia callipaeda]